MNRRRLVLVVIAFVIAIGAGVIFSLRHRREPEYNGRRLSEWLDNYGAGYHGIAHALGKPDAANEAADAVRHIGTNALPILLRWVQYEIPQEETKAEKIYSKLPPTLRDGALGDALMEDRRANHAMAASLCFEMLGSAATPAIPELMRLGRNTNAPQTACRALCAVGCMRRAGWVVLLEALADSGHPYRATIAAMLGDVDQHIPGLVPVLAGLVDNTKPEIALNAAGALGKIKREPFVAVPALTHALSSSNLIVRLAAVRALGSFGKAARPAVPLLLQMRESPSPSQRSAVTNALQEIAPEQTP